MLSHVIRLYLHAQKLAECPPVACNWGGQGGAGEPFREKQGLGRRRPSDGCVFKKRTGIRQLCESDGKGASIATDLVFFADSDEKLLFARFSYFLKIIVYVVFSKKLLENRSGGTLVEIQHKLCPTSKMCNFSNNSLIVSI